MFAKLAKFRAFDRNRARNSVATAVPCNDNQASRRAVASSPRLPRRILVCRWRKVAPAGALECSWHIERHGGPVADEPGLSWLTLPSWPASASLESISPSEHVGAARKRVEQEILLVEQ